MTTASFGQRVGPSLAVTTLVGLFVAAVAWMLGQPEAVRLALGGVVAGCLVVLASELVVVPLDGASLNAKLARMVLGLFIRGGGAVAALAIAILGFGFEPRTVGLVALPIYLSLLAGEIMGMIAMRRDATPTATAVGT